MNIQSPHGEQNIAAVLGLGSKARTRHWSGRLIGALVVAVIVGIVAWMLLRPSTSTAIRYETAEAAPRTLVVKVQATGTIQPTTQVEVSSERSGVIRTVNVEANSLVKRGEVLAQLDTERLEAELARDKAAVAASEARLADAKATLVEKQTAFRRAERLSKQGISSTADLDTARAAQDRAGAGVIAAEADIAVARAELTMTETDLRKTKILSPVDGIVLKRDAEPGQTVASSLQAPVLFTLAEDLKRMQLEADIDEADIGQVKPGQKASFTVDAYPGKSFPAVIDTVEYSPEVTDNVVTYKAVLTVDNGDLLLRPGMTATAQVVVNEVRDVLAVPNAALRYAPPRPQTSQGFSITSLFIPRMPRSEKSAPLSADGDRTVYVLEDGSPKAVKVHSGVTDGKETEILSGDLKVGDAVIVSAKAGGT